MRSFLLCLFALALFAGCAPEATFFRPDTVTSPYVNLGALEVGQIVHLPTGRMLTPDEAYAYLSAHRVIYVGESHDSVDDHALQLSILKAMEEKFPGRVAVGMEMLRNPSQEAADKWSRGELTEKEFVRVWVENWDNTFPYYADILRFIRDKKIPLVALNRPRARMHGANPDEPPPPPPPEPEVDYDDPYYKAFIGAYFAGHGEGKPDVAEKFLKGQLLWDETMAETAANFLKKPENADKKLIVIAGGNHVRYGFGMPRRLFRRLPDPYVIAETWVTKYPEEKVDKLMTEVHPPALPLPLATLIWGVGYTDLEDKIVRLGIGIEPAKPEGVRVKMVFPESSAEKAGILAEDVIVEIDGEPMKELFDLTFALTGKTPGQEGKVVVLRGEERKELTVTYAPKKHK